MTCENDKRITEIVYPTVDYVEEFDVYGTRVYKTLKEIHSKGFPVTRVFLCSSCLSKKARHQPVEERLRTIERAEQITPIADWTGAQKVLSKNLGLTEVFKVLTPPCTKCGATTKVRNDKTRGSLCETCYKEYRRDYMRDLMRNKRETSHVA